MRQPRPWARRPLGRSRRAGCKASRPSLKQIPAPRVVAIGGGTGLSNLLRGLKEYSTELTAVVTVADDGGSSGRLRREMGVLPPGDFRNCLAALSDADPLLKELWQYRFNQGSSLEGHTFGNLFMAALAQLTGSFERALKVSHDLLEARGRVLPSTLADVVLCAQTVDGSVVQGESSISQSAAPLLRVYLAPADVPAYPEALRAIARAQLIVLGPGSLYTSILPNLLIKEIRDAIVAAQAPVVFVCNIATQKGETTGYTVADHLDALVRHAGSCPIGYVLINCPADGAAPVRLGDRPLPAGVVVVGADVVNEAIPTQHDPQKLAQELLKIYNGRMKQGLGPSAREVSGCKST